MVNTSRHFPRIRDLVFCKHVPRSTKLKFPLTQVVYISSGLTLAISITCLGLSAHIVHVHRSDWGVGSPDWGSLALATSVISTVFLLSLYLLSIRRRGIGNAGFMARIPTELFLTFILWVLWLASGALIRDRHRNLSDYPGNIWRETRALEALSFTNFGLLYTYWVVLITLAGNASSRGGNHVWRSQANDFEWNHGNYSRGDGEKAGPIGRNGVVGTTGGHV
ncbi:hypothetical protein FA13DRAFT_640721 [Coprinellus micaceus]|uniref:MARVEL domain-containing protein n=1 Tax=Coprinellus micaceus TaxID=71717 RepID=A0A4Y7T5H1_COPMI|nr:hypothetical protein FA13DRAFT_640721 [Coprinellus micaceus]